MKKTSILLGLLAMGMFATAQTRMCLYEEFTGENCPPCASTNPGLNALLAANASKVIPIKWQVPIPSAPSNTWSLYQTDKAEINWRWRAVASPGYGYPCLACSPTVAYINSAPSGRMDGRELTAFGITGTSANHPGNLTGVAINSAQAQTTPFSITITPSWNGNFTQATVDIAVQSSANFTAVGNFYFRTVLVERLITFPTPPGTNGETSFSDPVRKCYSTVPSGTTISNFGDLLPSSWTAGQTQTLQLICPIPSYINDLGQMAFVGFIQDDGNKYVWQTARSTQPQIPNDAKAMSVSVASVSCGSTISPVANIKNNGSTVITDMTITPYTNGTPGTPVLWTGSLALGATVNVNMGTQNVVNGTNTFSININGVSGGDIVMSNNGTSKDFFNTATYQAGSILYGFAPAVNPPAGWAIFNPSNAQYTWLRNTSAGGFGLSSESERVFINWTAPNNYHDLYLPGSNLTGTTNPQIKFDLSYTQLTTNGNDKLEVMVSTDCGASWSTAWQNQGSAMATSPPDNAALHIPTASQWTAVTVSLLTYSNAPAVLLKFRATGGTNANQGNVIYLDNINLYDAATTGISTVEKADFSIEVFPNPVTTEANVKINTSYNGSASIRVNNALGQEVYNKPHTLTPGENNISIDCKDLAAGVYFVTIGSGKDAVNKKFVVSK